MPTYHDAIPDDWISPGETTAVDVEGIPVAIANVDGEYFAFGNFCPHQATPLGGQPLQRSCLIMCPEHHSMYDVRTGDCVMQSDDGFTGRLAMYETRVLDGAVQVSFG